MQEPYILPQKSELRKIKISEITYQTPDLKNLSESKAVTIGKWLVNLIKDGLAAKTFEVNNLLPSKADFAYFLGVSAGTMQNAFRYAEDEGVLVSKQCIGTMIKRKNSGSTMLRKLTSKREIAINEIKKYIRLNNFAVGDSLPSSRNIAAVISSSPNTTRLALESLCREGILERRFNNSRDLGMKVLSTDFEFYDENEIGQKTLVEKIVKDLKELISKEFKVGDRIPSHSELSAILKASIKTVHDALAVLIEEKILLARRGRYGTIVLNLPDKNAKSEKREMSIFAFAQDTAFYYYEKTQNKIKEMIAKDYEIGEKFPSILELSKELDLSPNTIRKAYQNLAKEGYLAFSRGRYGGTFVIDIPETGGEAFRWLAVNPQYTKIYKESEIN